MFSPLKYRIKKEHQIFAVGVGVASAIVLATAIGTFERLEVEVLDRFFRLRSFMASSTHQVDDRILIVTIGEEDISQIGRWPISDATLAELVRRVSEHEPASIGLDLYRNLPIEPGVDELSKVFKATPNAIGIERILGEAVAPHSTLAELDQTASSDLFVDDDEVIRRGLLSIIAPNGEVKHTLPAVLSLDYLSALKIVPEILDERKYLLQLGKGRVKRFSKNDGGYVNADTGGFQVLMNYQEGNRHFASISLSNVLAGRLTDEMVRDRVVLVGSTAISINDFFYTPMSSDKVAGVYVHAQLISQLLNVAIEGRPLLRTVPDYAEWLWTGLWISITVCASRSSLYTKSLKSAVSTGQLVGRVLGVSVGVVATGCGLFLLSWWLPVVLPLVATSATVAVGILYRTQQMQTLAAFDELTQVANRRYFDQHLADAMRVHRCLSVILCDVDYFKGFNDRYGHPAGDRCLQQVANALKLAIREADLVARYGGEEFVIVLPNTDDEMAVKIGQRIQDQVRQMKILHEGSQVSEWVTLSCGIANVSPEFSLSPLRLVEYADQALYEAKQLGRDRVVVSRWQALQDDEIYFKKAGEAA